MKISQTTRRWLAGRPRRLAIRFLLGSFACTLAAFSAAAEPAATPDLDKDPQLTGWWRFEEPDGTLAADSSKHGRHGQLLGGLTFARDCVPGRIGKALRWDGEDDLIRISGYKGVTGTEPRTITAWIKTDAPVGELASWGKDDFGRMWRFRFIRRRIGVTPNGGYYYMAQEVDDDTWHHVAVVLGTAELPNLHDDVTLYLDGKEAEVHRIGLLDLWPIETEADQDVTLGRGFKGSIDELRIYARGLTAEEIQTLHQQAK